MTDRGAIISDCGLYRYRLHRRVTASDRIALFIMLNPSTADAEQDDATIRRCKGFTFALGCGVLQVVNLFAFRTKSPKELKAAAEPQGPLNNMHIGEAAAETVAGGGFIICAWGVHGGHLDRDRAVVGGLLSNGNQLYSLDETADGFPRHPLYLPSACRPLLYRGRP